MKSQRLGGSYRDPSGYVFRRDGELYRAVSTQYAADYDTLVASGLYDALVADNLLVSHREVSSALSHEPGIHRVLRPDPIPFLSYPYEWCFGQLKAAALCTLAIQRKALTCGMVLKDASAYNVQFRGVRPVFIDTLSFERHSDGAPWMAYRQFCEHFLVPLLLVSRVDPTLARLLRIHLEGIPVELGARLLGLNIFRSVGSVVHVLLHSRSVREHGAAGASARRARVSTRSLLALTDNLEACIRDCGWEPRGTVWGDYETTHGYSAASQAHKGRVVAEMLQRIEPATVWDLGANTGEYSRMAAATGARVIALDFDPGAVEHHFQRLVRAADDRVLPLVMDLADPSPACGWNLRERYSLNERGPADAALALALVHHLAIGRNVPLDLIAEGLAGFTRSLIIEFVPKEDPQTQRLLAARKDVFPDYRQEAFEHAFASRFRLVERRRIADSGRVLYQLEAGP
jgi:ribosomal protein L11 methylase PrmA